MQNKYGWFVLWAVIAAWLLYSAGVFVYVAMNWSDLESGPCEATPDTSWSPPNVQLCPDDLDLWECIRTASYRSDI